MLVIFELFIYSSTKIYTPFFPSSLKPSYTLNKATNPSATCNTTAPPTSTIPSNGIGTTKEVLYIPNYKRYKQSLEDGKIISPAEMDIDMVIPSIFYEDDHYNYEGSPGYMDISGMMWIIKRFHTGIGGYAYSEYVVIADGTSTRKHLTHPETRST